MKKEEKIKKIEKLLLKHLDSCEGYERGETYLIWREKDELDYPNNKSGLFRKIAQDIIKDLEGKEEK